MQSDKKKILITGATGLLGRSAVQQFSSGGWDVVAVGYSRAKGSTIKLDLLDREGVFALIERVRPDFVLHAAAERRPDQCKNNEQGVLELNVKATAILTGAARSVGAVMLYVSTDYVFDGSNPPYTPTSEPNPLNFYGKSKLAGEQEFLRNMQLGHEDSTLAKNEPTGRGFVLRVPILYGSIEYLGESAITVIAECFAQDEASEAKEAPASDKECAMDNWAQRFPTHVDDVSRVCVLLANRCMDPNSKEDVFSKPIYHFSGIEQHTKYSISLLIGKLFGRPTSHIVAVDQPSSSAAPRPHDAHLDCTDLIDLLKDNIQYTPLEQGLKQCLSPFLQ